MIVVTGATGNTGKPLALALLAAGKSVRVISRSAEKAAEFAAKGAEVAVGDPADHEFMTGALKGAEAVYAMVPMSWNPESLLDHQKAHIDAIAAGVKANGVKYLVSLSSVGTHLEKDSGVVFGLRYGEQTYNAIEGLSTLHLRATYFMENTLGQLDVVKNMGIMGSPVKSDLKLSMIAAKDIGEYGAKRLAALDFHGHNIQYLLGQRDLTYTEVAKVYGRAIGKEDLAYVEFTYEDFGKALAGMGGSKSLVDNFDQFLRKLNEGRILEDTVRDAESTTPTSIEEFANIFAYLYNQK
ncbi:MAG: NmrA family NAD(P)-binding protein [Ignavibacteriaceae bacterium]|nr:NmrA family NAD(P)-binding protein [Ignavibacteriaceae bacterium]NUM71917.1 NmrA family NAD(P)-binding protein [Ignavibacteriaceae bacterium]